MARQDEFNLSEYVSFDSQRDEFNAASKEYSSNEESKAPKKKSDAEKRRADLLKAFLATVVVAGAATGVIPLISETQPEEPLPTSILPSEITIEFGETHFEDDPNLSFSLPGFHDEEERYGEFLFKVSQSSQLFQEQEEKLTFTPSEELSSISLYSFLLDQRSPIQYTLSTTYDGEEIEILSDTMELFPGIQHVIPYYLYFQSDIVNTEGSTEILFDAINYFDSDGAYRNFHYTIDEILVSGEIAVSLIDEEIESFHPFSIDINNLIDSAYALVTNLTAEYLGEEITLLDGYTVYLNIPNIYNFQVEYIVTTPEQNYFVALFTYEDPDDEIAAFEADFYESDVFLETQSWTKQEIDASPNGFQLSVNGFTGNGPLSVQYFALTKDGERKEITWSNITTN